MNNFTLTLDHCAWCNKPLPLDATIRRRFCDDTCRVEFSKKAPAGRKHELEELKQNIKPAKSNINLKELTRFPPYFETHWLPIARGEFHLPNDELVVKCSTYKSAHLLYKDWEAYTKSLSGWARREYEMKRTSIAEELELNAKAANSWKVEVRMADGRVRPQCKEDWSAPAILRFCPRHNRACDIDVMAAMENLSGPSEAEKDQGLIDDMFGGLSEK